MHLLSSLIVLASTQPIHAACKSLWVSTTPQAPKPYALVKGAGIKQSFGGSANIYAVTGNSSAKAFTLMVTNGGPDTVESRVFPHVHERTYENFYATKGRIQLWGQDLATYLTNSSVQESRILTPGDFVAMPNGTIHVFQFLEPDTTQTGVLYPGGFEEFFLSGAVDLSSPEAVAGLSAWDVYPQLDFVPREDLVNLEAGGGVPWYDGADILPTNISGPIWTAKNYGVKYLNSDNSRYQIVAPLITGAQTRNAFAQGHITLSPQTDGSTVQHSAAVKSTRATAFQIEEGQLAVLVTGYDVAHLIQGDIVFVPPNTTFRYIAEADFTKFMYVSGGADGLDAQLIKTAAVTDSAFYPTTSLSTRDVIVGGNRL